MKLWSFLFVSAVLVESALGTVDPRWTAYLEETLSEDERQYIYEWALEIDEIQGTTTPQPLTTIGSKRRRVEADSEAIELAIAESLSMNISVSDSILMERIQSLYPDHAETPETIRHRRLNILRQFCVPEWLHHELVFITEQTTTPSSVLLDRLALLVSETDSSHLRSREGLKRAVYIWSTLVIPAVRAWTQASPAPFVVLHTTLKGQQKRLLMVPGPVVKEYLRRYTRTVRARFEN